MFKLFLYPLSAVYGLIISIRNFLYDYKLFKSTEFEIPVISIGNITVGGTGKTPHTEYLVNLLRKQFIVTTISRGYKRKTKGYQEVEVSSLASAIGDEPLQIKTKFSDIQVIVDEKRVHAIKKIQVQDAAELPDVILLDDGFQHRTPLAGPPKPKNGFFQHRTSGPSWKITGGGIILPRINFARTNFAVEKFRTFS